jgi:hypothetical protein
LLSLEKNKKNIQSLSGVHPMRHFVESPGWARVGIRFEALKKFVAKSRPAGLWVSNWGGKQTNPPRSFGVGVSPTPLPGKTTSK